MKKFAVFALVLLMPLCLMGCNQHDKVLDNMSEMTKIYFKGSDGVDNASICVGVREEPYKKNGKHETNYDFSLITLALAQPYDGMRLPAVVTINGVEKQIELEYVSGAYMYDLEYALNPQDEVSLSYNQKTIDFALQEFEVDYLSAIKIGRETLESVLDDNEEVECYLRVLGQVGSEQLFWCFSIVTSLSEEYNCIIDMTTGKIITA